MSTLSDTARAVLTTASTQPGGIASPPEQLPLAAQRSVIRSMLTSGVLEGIAPVDGQTEWRTDEQGRRLILRATDKGLAAVGTGPADPVEAKAIISVREVACRPSLRNAARAVVAAWADTADEGRPELTNAIAVLRACLDLRGTPATRPRPPRTDTKRAMVLALLRRPEGATVAQVVDATGWARHTVHGFFAGLKKAGTPVAVLERVRQVGPGKQGAAGSYTVYCILGAA